MKHCARILDQSKCAHFVFVVKQLRLWPKKLVFRSYRRTKRGCWPHVTSDSPNAGVVFVVHCLYARPLSVVRVLEFLKSHIYKYYNSARTLFYKQ